MVAMHQLAALCIATTTLAFVPPHVHKPSHRLSAAPEGADLEELWRAHSKPLLRVLTKGGVPEPKIVAEAILKQRDAALSSTCDKKEAAPNECPFCFEIYTDDGHGSRVPRILPCGHTGCHGCFALMLRPAQPSADRSGKPLTCPVCRVVTNVAGGQAGSLPKNFLALN